MKLNQGFRHTLQVAARKAFRIHLSDRTGGGPAQELRIYLGQESQSIDARKVPTAIAWIFSEFAVLSRGKRAPATRA
jgi:hypothetical protein